MSIEKNKEENAENNAENFPGYPHYASKEDILNPDNNTERADVNMENISRSVSSVMLEEKQNDKMQNEDATNAFDNVSIEEDELQIVDGTEADVTEEDLLILESDGGEIVIPSVDGMITADTLNSINSEELDVPGAELDDANEALGEEDEENNYYSLGGDKEDILENEHE